MLFVILLVFLLMWAVELPAMLHRRDRGEIAAFAVLWALGLTLSLLLQYGVPLDGVTLFLRRLFDPLGRAMVSSPLSP